MTMHVGVSGTFKDVAEIHVGVGGAWKQVDTAYVGVGGAWKEFYSAIITVDQVTGLSVSVLSTTSLRTSWTAVTGADGYKVERSLTGTSGWSEVQDVTSGTTWDNTALNDGTRYYYRVRAYIGTTYGAYSTTENAVTTIKTPVLTSATKTGDTTASLVLTDGGSVSETQIRIYISTTGSGSGYSLYGYVAANSTGASLSGLAPDTQHWVKLRNYNSVAGESGDSTVKTFTTDPTPVGAVTDLVATPTCSGADLSWSDVSGETEYRVYKRQSTDAFALHTTLGAGATNYSVTGISGDWDFQVRGYNSGYGEGTSNTASASTLSVPSTGSISGVTQPNQGSDAQQRIVRVSYSGFTDATAYTVERDVDGAGSWTVLTTTETTGSYDDLDSSWGVGLLTPSTPTENTKTDTTITLNLATFDGDGLEIQRKTGAGGSWSTRATGVFSSTWQDTGLSPSTTYYYRVRNVDNALTDVLTYRVKGTNACGASSYASWLTGIQPEEVGDWATSAAITTDSLSPPAAPSNGDATDISAPPSTIEVEVTWTDNSSTEDGFKIYRSLNGGAFNLIHTTSAGVELWTDNTMSQHDDVQYRIYSYNAAGNSSTYTLTPTVTDVGGGA